MDLKEITQIFQGTWPWYISGPLIGLMVPWLLVLGKKPFGVSSSFRHLCAAVFPGGIAYFKYDWKAERWNLALVAGIVVGAALSRILLPQTFTLPVALETQAALHTWGIKVGRDLIPTEIFRWEFWPMAALTVGGGFLVGFGTRWADGCTSGHSITGLANLQLSSLVASIFFFVGGILSTHFILPLILR